MALVGRSPVRLTATTSSAPYESMVASLQVNIDQLVQKNKTYEHTIQKLQAALEDEKEHSTDQANRLRANAAQERETWKEGCDSLLASHRIVHLRTNMELEKSRTLLLKEKEENRRERLSILQRDYKLALFQARELELESKILELEDLLEEMAEQNEQDATRFVEQHEEQVESLKTSLKKSEALKKDALTRLREVEEDKNVVEKELASLRQEHTTLTSTSASDTTKLERVSLQLDGALSTKSELENENNELKRNNTDLKRQLDKWQNLETKGGAEIEEMRKRRVELEVKVKELEGRVKELEKNEKDNIKALEKERKRVEKRQAEIVKLQEVTEEAQDLASRAQAEETRLRVELEKLEREVQRISFKRSNAIEKIHESTPENRNTLIEQEVGHTPASEREVERALTPKPAKTRQRKMVTKDRPRSESEEGDPVPRKTNKGKGKAKATATESDAEETLAAGKKRKDATNSKNVTKAKRKVGQSDEDENAEEEQFKPDKKGKSRSTASQKSESRTEKEQTGVRKGKAKASSERSEEDAQPKKKKKLFPQAQPMSFAWDALPKVDNGLGIPTELSPVKETDVVPARSIFGRMGSALRWAK